jgi:hypothetical protein
MKFGSSEILDFLLFAPILCTTGDVIAQKYKMPDNLAMR